jgi:N-acyl-phosphatidylethanolamine-hydrolysing phospholipase D
MLNLKTLILCSVAVTVALALTACAGSNPHFDATKPHHRPTGFVNNYLDNSKIGEGFMRWQWARFSNTLPTDRPERVPRQTVDVAYLQSNRTDTTATWLGHATMLWQIGGKNILVDPIFSERASPVSFVGPQRLTPLPMRLDELPHIDAVVVSHNHYDHLDRPTVLALQQQKGGAPLFIVPLGISDWLKREGIATVQGLDWWQHHILGDAGSGEVKVSLVPAQHWSARGIADRHESLWGGFVVQHKGYAMYYSGDTGYSRDFADIAAKFGKFDFAQIPVGCYEPRWFMGSQHVNEPEAIQIHRDVGSKLSVGVHWGTFRLCDDPIDQVLDEFPKAAKAAGLKDGEFVLPALGQTFVLQRAGLAPGQAATSAATTSSSSSPKNPPL